MGSTQALKSKYEAEDRRALEQTGADELYVARTHDGKVVQAYAFWNNGEWEVLYHGSLEKYVRARAPLYASTVSAEAKRTSPD